MRSRASLAAWRARVRLPLRLPRQATLRGNLRFPLCWGSP